MYLELRDISKSFPGVKALQNVNLDVNEGEVVALLGENGAGKSTLMNILGGVIKADKGRIFSKEKEITIHNVADAQREGIAFIHQELSLFPKLTVTENLFIDNFLTKKHSPFLDKRAMHEKTLEIFKPFGIEIDPRAKAQNLAMGERQLVEIMSAVLKNSKIIILDEPTSSLTANECETLFDIVNKLRSENKLVIFISHDLDKALMLSDRVYVLRDGKNAGSGYAKDIPKNDIISMMVGDKAGKFFVKKRRDIQSEVVLELKNITTDAVKDVSLSARRGEVVGMYGLIGSGRTELIRALMGLDAINSGEVFVEGKKVAKHTPKALIDMGIAYLTENRREEGLFLELGVNINITITKPEELRSGPLRLISRKKDVEITNKAIRDLSIAVPGPFQLAGKLSGGNQQKVVIGKWLHRNPRIFILDEPTRGIDVGAKNEIYRLIDEIVNSGVTVILISSEIEEVLGMSDRVFVMARGRVAAELADDEITNENVIKYTMS